MEIKGITVLERDARGKIVTAAIHHRPLDCRTAIRRPKYVTDWPA